MIKLVILGVIVLAVFGTFSEYRRVKGLIGISGQLIRKSQAYQQSPIQPTKRILFAGDSTGAGTGASTPENSLAGLIGQANPDALVINLSINGLRSKQLAATLAPLASEKFDLAVLHIGGNDLIRFGSIKGTASDIKKVLDDLSPRTGQIGLFTTGNLGEAKFFPLVTRPIYTARAKALRNEMIELARDYPNVYYIDLFARTESLGAVGGYAKDELHLSDGGYQLWHKALKETLPADSAIKL